MEYTNYEKHPNNSIIDGFILQAPVSDREGIDRVFPGYQDSLDLAQQLMAQGKGNDCIPQDKGIPSLDVPISAYRLISLIGKKYVLQYTVLEYVFQVANVWLSVATTTTFRPI